MTDDPHRDLVRRETAISVAINVAMSGAVFIGMFGTGGSIPVDGWGGFAADFLPQAGAVGLMGSLIPGLLTRRRVRRGEIPAAVGRDGSPVLEHALLAALFAAAGFGGIAMLCFTNFGPETLAFPPALAIKLCFGACVAFAMTPYAVRDALCRPAARRRF